MLVHEINQQTIAELCVEERKKDRESANRTNTDFQDAGICAIYTMWRGASEGKLKIRMRAKLIALGRPLIAGGIVLALLSRARDQHLPAEKHRWTKKWHVRI